MAAMALYRKTEPVGDIAQKAQTIGRRIFLRLKPSRRVLHARIKIETAKIKIKIKLKLKKCNISTLAAVTAPAKTTKSGTVSRYTLVSVHDK